MGELLVYPSELKNNAKEMEDISILINQKNHQLKNIGQSLKNQVAYGNIAEVILALGEDLLDISKKVDKIGNVLEMSAREYEQTEKKISSGEKIIQKKKKKGDSNNQGTDNTRDEKTLGTSENGNGEGTTTSPVQPTVTPSQGGNGNPVGDLANGWLQLYDGPTVDQDGRQVTMPSGNNPNKWAMREGLDTINRYARQAIEGSNTVVQGPNGELLDSEGRYWVAVGPNVMNPDHQGSQACSAAEMKYGTKIDVIVTDGNGNKYYIPCVVGDCKAHTYPNGVYQTGDAFPNGTDSHPQNNDGSVIEFCGKGSISGFGDYAIESIVVYD